MELQNAKWHETSGLMRDFKVQYIYTPTSKVLNGSKMFSLMHRLKVS